MKVVRTRTIKTVKIDADKCTGCRSCEVICSAFHAEPNEPKYGVVNPRRARIRIVRDELNDLFIPILAGPYTDTECNARYTIVINGKEYGQCAFCRSSCPSRKLFKAPGAPDIPLKCDACGEPMPEGEPLCVQWCWSGALTYEPERVEQIEVKEEEEEEEVEEL